MFVEQEERWNVKLSSNIYYLLNEQKVRRTSRLHRTSKDGSEHGALFASRPGNKFLREVRSMSNAVFFTCPKCRRKFIRESFLTEITGTIPVTREAECPNCGTASQVVEED